MERNWEKGQVNSRKDRINVPLCLSIDLLILLLHFVPLRFNGFLSVGIPSFDQIRGASGVKDNSVISRLINVIIYLRCVAY